MPFSYIFCTGSPKSLLAVGWMSSFYLSEEGIPQKMASNSSIDLFLSVQQTFNANIFPVKFLQRHWASETVEVKRPVFRFKNKTNNKKKTRNPPYLLFLSWPSNQRCVFIFFPIAIFCVKVATSSIITLVGGLGAQNGPDLEYWGTELMLWWHIQICLARSQPVVMEEAV